MLFLNFVAFTFTFTFCSSDPRGALAPKKNTNNKNKRNHNLNYNNNSIEKQTFAQTYIILRFSQIQHSYYYLLLDHNQLLWLRGHANNDIEMPQCLYMFLLNGSFYSSVWSTKIFLYNIRGPRYDCKRYQISKIWNNEQSWNLLLLRFKHDFFNYEHFRMLGMFHVQTHFCTT